MPPSYKPHRKQLSYIPRYRQVNLAVAMLETGQTGVRQHVDNTMQMIMVDSEMRDEIKQSIEDGLNRKPEWKNLKRVKTGCLNLRIFLRNMKINYSLAKFSFSRFLPSFIQLFLASGRGCRAYSSCATRSGPLV